MKTKKRGKEMKTGLFIVGLLVVAAGSVWAQGSLTPPGAPAPTMRTLDEIDSNISSVSNTVVQESADLSAMISDVENAVDEVEARIDVLTLSGDANFNRVISQPGSYYLSGNLKVTQSSGGIKIISAGVTLDLNGYKVFRSPAGSGYGIYLDPNASGTIVRNGTVSGMQYGVFAIPSVEDCLLYEKLALSDCSSYGLCSGSASRVVDCRVFDGSGSGIYVYDGSVLTGCMVYGCQGSYGIYSGDGSVLEGCVSKGNGSTGMRCLDSSSLKNCCSVENGGTGFSLASDMRLESCVSKGNGGTGFYTQSRCSMEGCVASSNKGQYGIRTGTGSCLIGCVANANEGSNLSSFGIYSDYGSTIVQCSVYQNSNTNSPGTSVQGCGVFANNGSMVKDCTVVRNEGDGIKITGDCEVSGNTCDSNGYGGDGAGIHASSSDNRIDGNNVTDNDRGIDIDLSGNFITRNTASGNTVNYDIAAGNDVGTIQTSPVGAGAWDNFEY